MHSKCFYHWWKIKRMSKRHILTYIFGRYLKPFRNPIGVLQSCFWSIGHVLRTSCTKVLCIHLILYSGYSTLVCYWTSTYKTSNNKGLFEKTKVYQNSDRRFELIINTWTVKQQGSNISFYVSTKIETLRNSSKTSTYYFLKSPMKDNIKLSKKTILVDMMIVLQNGLCGYPCRSFDGWIEHLTQTQQDMTEYRPSWYGL